MDFRACSVVVALAAACSGEGTGAEGAGTEAGGGGSTQEPSGTPDESEAGSAVTSTGASNTAESGSDESASTGEDTSGGVGSSSEGSTTGDACAEPTFDCDRCDAIVPDDFRSIQAAVDSVNAPGLVCVRAGVYAEDVVAVPHVSLRGVGTDTRIEGSLRLYEMADPDATPTLVTDLQIVGFDVPPVTSCVGDGPACAVGGSPFENAVEIGDEYLALSLRRVVLERYGFEHAPYCFLGNWLGNAAVEFIDSVCRGVRGIRMRQYAGVDTPAVHSLLVEGSRFESPPDGDFVGSALEFLSIGFGSEPSAHADTRPELVVRNSEFLEASIGPPISYAWGWPENQNAECEIVHNTFSAVSEFPESCFADVRDLSESDNLTVSNNLVAGYSTLFECGSDSFVVPGSNQMAEPGDFVDLASGDVHLVAGAPAIDAADPAHLLPVDIAGTPRPIDGDQDGFAVGDMGAHEFEPTRARLSEMKWK